MTKYMIVFGVKDKTPHFDIVLHDSAIEAMEEAEMRANMEYGLTREDVVNYFKDMGEDFIDQDVEDFLEQQRNVHTIYEVYQMGD